MSQSNLSSLFRVKPIEKGTCLGDARPCQSSPPLALLGSHSISAENRAVDDGDKASTEGFGLGGSEGIASSRME